MRHLPIALLGAVFVVAAIVVMHAGRDTTFYYDDWNFVTMRFGWNAHDLLYPHNEHLSLLPVLVYKTLFETVGLDNYGVFRAVSLGFNLTCGALLFIYVRRRLGDWIALGLATALVVMGAGAWDIVWPFQIGFLGSLAATLGALLMLDRQTRRGDIAACLLIVVALSSSSLGVMLVGGVLLEVLLREGRWRRIWIPLIPALLYGTWYLKYGVGHLDLDKGLPKVPAHVSDGMRAGIHGATGIPHGTWLIAIVLTGCFLWSFWQVKDRRPRLLLVAALPLAFWVLEALARTGLSAAEPRYMYPNGLYVDLLAAEAMLIFRPRVAIGVGAAVLLVIGAFANASDLANLGNGLRSQALASRSSLTAGDLLRDKLDPKTLPDPSQPQLFLGLYEDAVAKYDSTIAWSPAEIPERSPSERLALDFALIRLIQPAVQDTAAPAPKRCGQFPGDGQDRGGSLTHGRLYIKAGDAPVELRLRRFGDGFLAQPQAVVPPQTQGVLTMPADRAKRPWIVAVRSASTFAACQA